MAPSEAAYCWLAGTVRTLLGRVDWLEEQLQHARPLGGKHEVLTLFPLVEPFLPAAIHAPERALRAEAPAFAPAAREVGEETDAMGRQTVQAAAGPGADVGTANAGVELWPKTEEEAKPKPRRRTRRPRAKEEAAKGDDKDLQVLEIGEGELVAETDAADSAADEGSTVTQPARLPDADRIRFHGLLRDIVWRHRRQNFLCESVARVGRPPTAAPPRSGDESLDGRVADMQTAGGNVDDRFVAPGLTAEATRRTAEALVTKINTADSGSAHALADAWLRAPLEARRLALGECKKLPRQWIHEKLKDRGYSGLLTAVVWD